MNGIDFLKDWYNPEVMKAALGDVTTKESIEEKVNAIIAVQSESGVQAYGLEDDKEQDSQLIKDAVNKEFKQAFELLDNTKLPMCFIRGIPHYDEGYQARVAGHYIFLYFFLNHKNKKSVLVVDPQGSKFGDRLTDQGEVAIDEECVDIIYHAAKTNNVTLYVSQDVIQQDGYSCGPVSVELARAFYEVSGNEKKRKKLFEILKRSESKETKLSNDSSVLKYQLCTLGNSITSQNIIDDFNNKTKHELTGSDGKSHVEEVGGQKVREIHRDTYDAISKSGKAFIKSGESNFIPYVKPLLIKLGADESLLDLKELSPSFKSGIITGLPLVDKNKLQQKREELFDAENKKTVGIQSQKSTTCLAVIGVASIFSIILFSLFLSTNTVKKEVAIPGLVLSFIVLVGSVVACFMRNKEETVKPVINNSSTENLNSAQQPVAR